jgi:hypothetical protein
MGFLLPETLSWMWGGRISVDSSPLFPQITCLPSLAGFEVRGEDGEDTWAPWLLGAGGMTRSSVSNFSSLYPNEWSLWERN